MEIPRGELAVDQVRSDTAQGKRLELNNATSGGYLAAGMDAAAALLEHCERRGMTDDQTTRVLQLRERGMSDTDALARVAQESELTALLGSPNPMHGAGLVHPEASEQNSSLAALNSDTA